MSSPRFHRHLPFIEDSDSSGDRRVAPATSIVFAGPKAEKGVSKLFALQIWAAQHSREPRSSSLVR